MNYKWLIFKGKVRDETPLITNSLRTTLEHGILKRDVADKRKKKTIFPRLACISLWKTCQLEQDFTPSTLLPSPSRPFPEDDSVIVVYHDNHYGRCSSPMCCIVHQPPHEFLTDHVSAFGPISLSRPSSGANHNSVQKFALQGYWEIDIIVIFQPVLTGISLVWHDHDQRPVRMLRNKFGFGCRVKFNSTESVREIMRQLTRN